jgi:hypothetical protein
MAIKRVAILMEINTSEKEEASGCVRTDDKGHTSVPGADETYKIYINDDQEPGPEGKPNKYGMLTSASHEVGHVLSAIFKLPNGMHEDPRSTGEVTSMRQKYNPDSYSPDQKRRVYHNEKQAWEIARKVWPELDEEIAESCLNSYNWAKPKAA